MPKRRFFMCGTIGMKEEEIKKSLKPFNFNQINEKLIFDIDSTSIINKNNFIIKI